MFLRLFITNFQQIPMILRIKALFSTVSTLKKTCLNAVHLEHSGKMVEFADYELPVQYKAGIMKEHLHCRASASIFDVSHMGQITIIGSKAVQLLQRVTVGSTNRQQMIIGGNLVSESYLTLLLNQQAGIVDDTIACIPEPGKVRLVVNGANKYTVLDCFNRENDDGKFDARVQLHEEKGLIAFQGPKSAEILQRVLENGTTKLSLKDIPFMGQAIFRSPFNQSDEYLISRSGYTGQDGFEISSSGSNILQITKRLLQFSDEVMLAGLGARDSLRTEAGLCLHGHDISQANNPLEALLMWCVVKRSADKQQNRLQFIGEEVLRKLAEEVKAKRTSIAKRVGFIVPGAGIARGNCTVFDLNNREIGNTTSGTFSPSLKKCVGMAYVEQKFTKEGTELQIQQRGKIIQATVKKMPFIPARYYKGKVWE